MSDDQLRRLKQLSAAQTIFLKAYLSKKVAGAAALIEETVKLIEAKGAANDDRLASIRSNLAALKIHELDVDSGKAEDIVKAEMALLRGAVDGSPVSVSSAGGSSAADAAKISALEAENTKLRDLLAEAQRELLSAAKSKTAADSSKEEWAAELAALNGLVQKHEASLRSQAAAIDAKSKQLDAAEAEVASLKSASSNSSSKSQEEVAVLAAALAKSRRELEEARVQQTAESAAAAAQLKALEERMSAEKEELMEAVAQEVELVERTKAEEAAALQLSVAALEAQVTASRKESGDLASGLQKLHKAAHDMSSANAHVSAVTRKELGEMRVALLNNFKGEFVKKLRHANKEYLELKDKYLKEMGERRRLHNIVAELKGNIRVFMRCRPPTKKELDQFGNDALCVSFSDLVAGEVRVFNADKGRDKSWEFDEVFDLAATQEKVYREVSPLVISVLDGYNACIFAYGQTGSGKTFTMSGPPDDFGVNTRALVDLFDRIAERAADFRDSISVSLLEVYNEEIRDLLVDARTAGKLEVKQGEFGNYVPGLTTVPVSNVAEVIEVLALGDKNRSSATTNMNEHSSRSHMMLTVSVQSENASSGVATRGKLNLVDLAGSERIDKSGATGQALKEAQNINQSLSALGDVIQARGNKQAHIPFRNSTLTYLLQDSLSKDSKTLMFVCVSPVSYNAEETFCSLNFASRVRAVELGKASKNTSAPASAASSTSSTASSGKPPLKSIDSRRTLGK